MPLVNADIKVPAVIVPPVNTIPTFNVPDVTLVTVNIVPAPAPPLLIVPVKTAVSVCKENPLDKSVVLNFTALGVFAIGLSCVVLSDIAK